MDNILKIKATLLYVLKGLDGKSDFIKIFKIIYFASQTHLVKYGRPIIQDDFIAMPKGPVPSWLYNAVQKKHKDVETYKPISGAIKHDLFSHYKISSQEQPDLDELSQSDIECLDKSIRENRNLSSDTLSDNSHDSAWKKREGRAMSLLDIAEAGGAKPEMLEYIAEDMAMNAFLESCCC